MPNADLNVNARALSVRLQEQTYGFTRAETLLALAATLGGMCLSEIPEPRPIEIEELIDLLSDIARVILECTPVAKAKH